MDYRDRLSEIFDGRGPTSLRIIFDCDSTEWTMVSMEKKVHFLQEMINSGYPLERWIEDYEQQYRDTNPHILKSINKTVEIIYDKLINGFLKNQLSVYLDEVDLRSTKKLSKTFLYNSFFNMKDGVDVACIKKAYRDMNRTLKNFQIVIENGKRLTNEEEKLRAIVREDWKLYLLIMIKQLKVISFQTNQEFDNWHNQMCIGLMKVSSHRLTFGQSQKWINMIIKYLVVCGDQNILKNIKFFHIPIDSLIMKELNESKFFKISKFQVPWSKIEDQDEYLKYQKAFREIIFPKVPLIVEFALFNKIIS